MSPPYNYSYCEESMQPSICLVTIDSWRFDALECAASHDGLERFGVRQSLSTPNLRRIANESIYFTQALSCAPHTTVSHSSLMTGLPPPQHGVRSFFYERLPEHVETLAEALRPLGYATITLRESEDSSHPGILQVNGVLRGFDYIADSLSHFAIWCQHARARGHPVFAFLHLWDMHVPYLYAPRCSASLEPLRRKIESLCDSWHVTPPDSLGEAELARFRERVALAVPDVHTRIRTLFEWYIEGVSWFDREQWPIIEETLQKAGLWDDGVTFMYGDHGERAHPEGYGADVFGHGWTIMDDVIRVPLIMRGAPGIPARAVPGQVSLTDIAPTAAELAGVDLRTHFRLWQTTPFAGRSLLPLANGVAPANPSVHIAEVWRGQRAIADGGLIRQSPYLSAVRTETHKVVRHDGDVFLPRYSAALSAIERGRQRWGKLSGRPAGETYYFATDLRADPGELHPARATPGQSDTAGELIAALEHAYTGALEGPAIVLDSDAEDPVVERLRGLGYIDC